MEPLTLASFTLAVISLSIGLYSLFYRILKDRPKLVIIRTSPGLGGSRTKDEPWKYSVSSVEARVKNVGKRPAMRVRGVISFGKFDALPLYPTEKGNVIFQEMFDLAPGEERGLVAAWAYHGNAIDGTRAPTVGEFLDKAPPMRITIEYSEGKVSKEYTKEFLESLIRKHEERKYLQR